ncbi:nuclear pore complex protein NUP98B [Hordeum vulgare]|nr:nuclear pore complex protein NUP98B [Hordeum vulgare]
MRGGRSGGGGGLRNPCLTRHQPWASLLVHGIKRVEGRSWPSPVTGRLWIHAASKVPDPDTVAAMEDFYREIYAVDGGASRVVGCVRSEELVCWEDVPQSVRLEGLTDFCWLCENPQKLVVPFEMRGYQGVYNLERRVYEGAARGLSPVQGPLPVKFPLPDPRNPLSLKPGSLNFESSKSVVVKTESVFCSNSRG